MYITSIIQTFIFKLLILVVPELRLIEFYSLSEVSFSLARVIFLTTHCLVHLHCIQNYNFGNQLIILNILNLNLFEQRILIQRHTRECSFKGIHHLFLFTVKLIVHSF